MFLTKEESLIKKINERYFHSFAKEGNKLSDVIEECDVLLEFINDQDNDLDLSIALDQIYMRKKGLNEFKDTYGDITISKLNELMGVSI